MRNSPLKMVENINIGKKWLDNMKKYGIILLTYG
jgi:hypothetical protein